MATIVNNPAPTADSSNGMAMAIGIVGFIVVLYLFFIYGLPAIRQTGSPQINLPGKIDVNVNQTK